MVEQKDEKIVTIKRFKLFDSFDIIDDVPPPFKKVSEDRKQMIEFFDKIPENKVMKIRFPNEYLWKTYFIALKYYASEYPFDMQFNKRKDEDYYVIYIKKLKRTEIKTLKEVEDEKDMEIKSI